MSIPAMFIFVIIGIMTGMERIIAPRVYRALVALSMLCSFKLIAPKREIMIYFPVASYFP